MRGRRTAIDAAERRLALLARDWLPAAGGPAPDAGAPPDPDERWATGAESSPRRPVLRSIALLLAVGMALAGYWAWTGRPRDVVAAPAVLAMGAPLASAAVATPVPTSAPASSPTMAAFASPAEPPAPPDLVVHVIGQVARPGLVRLAPGARVADAIDRAGGVTRRRAAETVNLARLVVDGEQIVVGAGGASTGTGTGNVPAPAPAAGVTAPPVVVDLNAADAAALEALPGIGPVLAARIIAWRAANGPFRAVEELGEVSGVGDAILGQVRSLLRV